MSNVMWSKRDYDKMKSDFHTFLLDDLTSQEASIDSFVHSDELIEVLNLRETITGNPKRYENIPIQFSRFNECYYNSVLPYMNKNKIEYDFFVCTRPDNIYFQNCLEKIKNWSKDEINVRMRRYPNDLDINPSDILNVPH